jgi:uncharacterized protein
MQIRLVAAAAFLALTAYSPISQAGYKEGMDALAVRDYARARAEFELERSEAKALFELSRMAMLGLGEPANDVRASSLLRQAAEMGHVTAKMEYAFALGNGRGVDKDPLQAIRLFTALSDAGNTEAKVNLGRVYRYGWWDQPKDEPRALALFQAAMEAGDDNGRLQYASMLTTGSGAPKNEARAAELLRQSADRGHLDSQLEYARMLTFGIGVPKDEAAGTALYQKVAENSSNRIAQFSLGMAYLRGRGVPRDELAAVRWIDASARQGWPWAQLQLGDMFRQGTGVPRVRNEAYLWYSIAARNTIAAAVDRANALRNELAREMAQADLVRLAGRAEAFRVQTGFRPRMTAFPPLAHGDRIELGPVSLKIPAPKGYANNWQFVERMQQAYPNDPDQRPWLMVLQSQEDGDRLKLGLPGGLRRIELSRHFSDDSINVTTKLFGELKAQLRSQIDANIAAGRYQSEGMVHDDERSFSFVRSSVTEPNRFDALAFLLVKERVVIVAFVGFVREQKAELTALVKNAADEIQSANRSGFFSQ